MNIKNWLTNQITRIMISTANVEKNAFGQNGESLETDVNKHQRLTQGQLADSLIKGEITQETLNLKWRTYKIIKATEGVKSTITGYDEDDMPIVKTTRKNPKLALKKVKVDEFDDYKLEMVLDNSEIALNTTDIMGNEHLSILDTILENYDDNGSLISASHATINANELMATEKGERPIKIERPSSPNFFIENFTKKLNIRKINKKERLLEFYVSKYADEYNRTSRLFLSAIKKVVEGTHQTFLELDEIEFITYKTVGSEDFLLYKYDNLKFDKIVEFNGFFVIKFKANISINGKDILEQHKVEELEKKYELKAKK
jgi:transcriptional regulator with PAS, ATPase and Fis domain